MRPSASLSQHTKRIVEVISRYPVRNPRLFGSAARGEDTEESDIDILVDADPRTTYYDLARLEMELEGVLGCKVQVMTPGDLAPDIAKRVEPDLRPIR